MYLYLGEVNSVFFVNCGSVILQQNDSLFAPFGGPQGSQKLYDFVNDNLSVNLNLWIEVMFYLPVPSGKLT